MDMKLVPLLMNLLAALTFGAATAVCGIGATWVAARSASELVGGSSTGARTSMRGSLCSEM
jgi:hypothetical protein